MSTFRAEEHQKREDRIEGWPVRITSYRVGSQFRSTVDNIDPGATVARGAGPTREAAEQEAISIARERLAKVKRLEASLSAVHESMAAMQDLFKKGG
ncbi:MAG TPA: hypothetical protein VND93_26585 [Myxococcales bacterium]|jgi:hypothetical protein|nr:hypothetical protein [Myxococcales bacterium]